MASDYPFDILKLLVTALSVFLRFSASDCPFAIVKLFCRRQIKNIIIILGVGGFYLSQVNNFSAASC